MRLSGKPIIYITDYITVPDIERGLSNPCGYEVKTGELTDEERERVVGLLVWHEQIDAHYLGQFPNIKGIVRYGVGFDEIDLEHLKKAHIPFGNTPDYGTDEVADTAIAMLMCGVRGITQYQTIISGLTDGSWQENVLPELKRTKNMRLGVVGLGRIGTSVALKCKAIGFQVGFYDPYLPSGIEKSLGITRFDTLAELLDASGAISIHTPLNDETAGLIDKGFLARMQRGGILVNTARGGLLKELDLIFDALKDGKLGFAGLDVIPEEPVAPGHRHYEQLLYYMRGGQLIVNPHTAYYSQESLVEMRQSATLNLRRFLEGEQSIANRIC